MSYNNRATFRSDTKNKIMKEQEIRIFTDALSVGDIVKYIPKDPKGVRMFYVVLSLDKGEFSDGTFMFNKATVQKIDNHGNKASNKFTTHVSKIYRYWLQIHDRVSYKGSVHKVDKIAVNEMDADEVHLIDVTTNKKSITTDLNSLKLIV